MARFHIHSAHYLGRQDERDMHKVIGVGFSKCPLSMSPTYWLCAIDITEEGNWVNCKTVNYIFNKTLSCKSSDRYMQVDFQEGTVAKGKNNNLKKSPTEEPLPKAFT
ncbi:hypothetical protein E2C01_014070 [Portunus trituberculatus]|uniref:Uncharacterized protein n=1 Tax=Portunus trituberculatus TaxID=210409 RepID=A0A5B7DJ83_PORTR|nr:hypothetical protein [Portunus trituberculatus]